MNRFLVIKASAIAAALLLWLAAAPGCLAQSRSRLLLIFAPAQSDPHWQKQNALLRGSAAAFRDRDLLRRDYLEQGSNTGRALRSCYGIKPGGFRVLLIGKDGHVASGGQVPLSLGALTAQIDRMPMRRDEMRRRER